jgi:Rab-like protein 3
MSSIFERVKILVAGDSGVGKTSLVHLIAHQDILKKSSWTIGCSVDVKVLI